jgi:hypothetical protein
MYRTMSIDGLTPPLVLILLSPMLSSCGIDLSFEEKKEEACPIWPSGTLDDELLC